ASVELVERSFSKQNDILKILPDQCALEHIEVYEPAATRLKPFVEPSQRQVVRLSQRKAGALEQLPIPAAAVVVKCAGRGEEPIAVFLPADLRKQAVLFLLIV